MSVPKRQCKDIMYVLLNKFRDLKIYDVFLLFIRKYMIL